MSVIGRMYVTIGPDGEPRRVYGDRERADEAAIVHGLSVQVVMPEFQHRGAVEERAQIMRSLQTALDALGDREPGVRNFLANLIATYGGAVATMSNIERGVWHKDGPVAQIEAMIEWLGTPYERPDDEHIGKVQVNLRASADALRGAVCLDTEEHEAVLRVIRLALTGAEPTDAPLVRARRKLSGGQ